MAGTTTDALDAEELFHLAVGASETSRHEDAIGYLKRASALAPKDGRIRYLLGAEHAQIRMYDRAAAEMAEAVELDPNLHAARFQLGLLHITAGRAVEAEQAWKPLDALGENHFLYLFKTGLLHLVRDEFDRCAAYLKRGIAGNTINAALNNDMRRILAEAEKHLAENSAPVAAAPDPAAPTEKSADANHVLLSAYRRNRKEEKD